MVGVFGFWVFWVLGFCWLWLLFWDCYGVVVGCLVGGCLVGFVIGVCCVLGDFGCRLAVLRGRWGWYNMGFWVCGFGWCFDVMGLGGFGVGGLGGLGVVFVAVLLMLFGAVGAIGFGWVGLVWV